MRTTRKTAGSCPQNTQKDAEMGGEIVRGMFVRGMGTNVTGNSKPWDKGKL
jgi:hypothetical protein